MRVKDILYTIAEILNLSNDSVEFIEGNYEGIMFVHMFTSQNLEENLLRIHT